MSIKLSVFAEMLCMSPVNLLSAVRTTGKVSGLKLPACRSKRGGDVTFNYDEAVAFMRKWKSHNRPRKVCGFDEEKLVSLNTLAARAGITPLALYMTVISGHKLAGIKVPRPVASGRQIFFSESDADSFLKNFITVHSKTV